VTPLKYFKAIIAEMGARNSVSVTEGKFVIVRMDVII